MSEEEVWRRHTDAALGNVVLAVAWRWDGGDDIGIFTSIEKARAFYDPLVGKDYKSVGYYPHVVNKPGELDIEKIARGEH